MKKLNKKGFTLIELLAVIVVLAVIMVIATQQINKTISRTRANSMISSLKMAANGVKTKIADGSITDCNGEGGKGSDDCLDDDIDYNKDEYTINVAPASTGWTITLAAKEGSEFAAANFYNAGYNDTPEKRSSEFKKIKVEVAQANGSKYPKISCTVDSEGNMENVK